MDVLELLDEDCWECVLAKVDPRDLKSCTETCVLFKKILYRTKGGRNNWLFGEILPYLFDYLYVGMEEYRSGCCRFPNPYWKAMLDCRLVCKSWCCFTDHYLETNVEPEYYPGSRHPTAYNFYEEETISAFLVEFGRSRRNPLIGRNISIKQFAIYGKGEEDINEEERMADEGYTAKLDEFLSVFGKDVWTVSLGETKPSKHLEYCRNVESVLAHFPNLRTLQLTCIYRHPNEEAIKGLDDFIVEAAQLPVLPHLVRMSFDTVCQQMAESLLAKYSGQLEFVKVGDFKYLKECITTEQLALVKELEIREVEENDDTLELLRLLRSPLKKLTISLSFGGGFQVSFWAIDKFLMNINHLAIRELTIISDGPFIGEFKPIPPSLKNHSIKKVSITCDTGYIAVSFNFLRCLKNLEEVEFTCHSNNLACEHPMGFGETIKVQPYLMEDNLYESNIWEAVPSLKKFSFLRLFWYRWNAWHYYYREVYDKFRDENQGATDDVMKISTK